MHDKHTEMITIFRQEYDQQKRKHNKTTCLELDRYLFRIIGPPFK